MSQSLVDFGLICKVNPYVCNTCWKIQCSSLAVTGELNWYGVYQWQTGGRYEPSLRPVTSRFAFYDAYLSFKEQFHQR